VELGLAHDAADLLRGPDGRRLLSRFEYLVIADQVVEDAWKEYQGGR